MTPRGEKISPPEQTNVKAEEFSQFSETSLLEPVNGNKFYECHFYFSWKNCDGNAATNLTRSQNAFQKINLMNE